MANPNPADCQVRAERVGMQFPAGHIAISSVTFGVCAGEFLSVVGPSGCGKSTLLRMIAGLIKPTQGEVTIANRPAVESRGRIGFVFQDPRLLPWRSASQNISLPLELEHAPVRQRAERAAQALNLVGLTPADAPKLPRMLSGGMRMRVSLARALITQPAILLLDEPFSALDDVLRQQLNDELLRIWGARRPTAIFVTHHVAEAVYLSQRVLVFTPAPGRIAAEIEVPFEYPRRVELRSSTEFARCTGEVSLRLRETAQSAGSRDQ